MGRRLIICSDGTWQDLHNKYPTNVAKTAQSIEPVSTNGQHQIVYYDNGLGTNYIGTKGSIIDILNKLGGGGVGLGIDHKIQEAYLFLCLNYQPGDEVFLFGFSRGAYTVRCLAGLIYNSGLPKRKFFRKIPEAYELYRDRNDSARPNAPDAIHFRCKYGERIPIKALCCWDTVASMGLPDLIPGVTLDSKFNERYSFHDFKLNPDIEHAFHAIAIDETRKVYNFTPMESQKPGQLSQVWFPGGHGCVGGGSQEERGLSDRALEWMLNNTSNLGLSVNTENIEYGEINGIIEYGIKPLYKTPFESKKSLLGNEERILPKSLTISELDISTRKRWKDPSCNYRPQNLAKLMGDKLDSFSE